MSDDWCIQNADGKYWGPEKVGKGVNTHHLWRPDHPARYKKYFSAAVTVGNLALADVRIVPAPPPEMTDAEAEAWFKTLNPTYRIKYNASDNFWVQGVRDANLGSGNVEWISIGHTIFDAIRAARRKLEGGK